jgi:hypothetical protein
MYPLHLHVKRAAQGSIRTNTIDPHCIHSARSKSERTTDPAKTALKCAPVVLNVSTSRLLNYHDMAVGVHKTP